MAFAGVNGATHYRGSKLTQDDLDKLRNVSTWTGSPDLYFLVKGHVEATISSIDDVSVEDVSLLMTDGRSRRGYTANKVQTVLVKLSNGGVVQISVDVAYVTRMVVHYAGYKKAQELEEQKWYVYVVRCNDNSLYCGISKNVENRVAEHNGNCRGAKYTRSRRPVTLVKHWELKNKSEALKAERRFKKLSKEKKEEICSS
jgi:putative endonuclease